MFIATSSFEPWRLSSGIKTLILRTEHRSNITVFSKSSLIAFGSSVILALCRQFVKISSLLLRVACSSWNRMYQHSRRQSRRCLHLSLIAPSNVPFSVKGGGTFGGPQLFSFCTWKLFAFQGSSGHQWQKNIKSPLLWPELYMQYNESEVHRTIPPNPYFGLDN